MPRTTKIVQLIVLFCTVATLYAKDNIELYNAYGNEHHLFIQGRTVVPKKFQAVQKDDNMFKNLWRRARQIESDEIEDAKISVTIQGKDFSTHGDSEGYFDFNIDSPQLTLASGYQKIRLAIEGNPDTHTAEATIIESHKKILGIICDIDDTVMISNVPSKIKLAINTLFKNYKQRKAVATMAQRLKSLLAQNPKGDPSTLFFLSGSPQQLFKPIEAFLAYNHFPKHILILKKAHGTNKDPLTDQFAYKTQKIERLFRLYPNMVWVMFGDSGEKDKEVYQQMQQKYPKRVKAFYIRNVKTGEIKEYFH